MIKIFTVFLLLLSTTAYADDNSIKKLFSDNAAKIEAYRDLSNDCKIEIKVRGKKAKGTQACKDFVKVAGEMKPMIKAMEEPGSKEAMRDPAIIDTSIQLLEGNKNFKYIVYRLTN